MDCLREVEEYRNMKWLVKVEGSYIMSELDSERA